jgi:hypothetical protein
MEPQVQLAYREMWDQQEQLEFQGMMELQVQQAQLELLDRMEQLARLAYKVMSELLVLLAQRD